VRLARATLLACLALLCGCSMVTKFGYNRAHAAMRTIAWDYLDLDYAQSEQLNIHLGYLHDWHRATELPLYAGLLSDASRRVARGMTPADATWAFDNLRARYRAFTAKTAEELAPVLATLGTAQIAELEQKVAQRNSEYAKEYLPRDDKRGERARVERALDYLRDWTGTLTPVQETRVGAFIRAHSRYYVLRFEDRQRWERDAIALVRQHLPPAELAPRLSELFTRPEARRSDEFAQEERRWEDDFGQLAADIDRTLSPQQRARIVNRLDSYAEDFTDLAAQKRGAS
jgi:Family of unknown function (DUF6279)